MLRLGSSAVWVVLSVTSCGGRSENQPPDAGGSSGPVNVDTASSNDTENPESGASSVETEPSGDSGSTTAPAGGSSSELTTTSTFPDAASTLTSEPVTHEPGPPDPVIDPAPAACEGMCGNSAVDSCETCDTWGSPGLDFVDAGLPAQNIAIPPMMCTTQTEQCDGVLDAEQTCEAIGFAGGTLGCSQVCRYDDSGCDSCLTNPSSAACRDDLGAGAAPSHVALAATSTELVAAWNEGCTVKLGWFDETLATLHTTTLPDAPCVPSTGGISLARLGSQWVVEVGTQQYVVDPAGELLSSRSINGSALFAASREGSAPLVVRQTSYGVVTASLLEDSGAEAWTSEVSDSVIEAHYGSAAAVESGFLVALRTDSGVQVFHLEGALGTLLDVNTPAGEETEYPQLNASDGQVRLVWADFGGTPSVYWAKLDETGKRVGDSVQIGGTPTFFNRSPIVVDGDDTVVLFGGYTGTTGVGRATHVRRVDAAGVTTAGDVAVQSDPNWVQWPQIVAFGGGFVNAWVGKGESGRVGLAKVNL